MKNTIYFIWGLVMLLGFTTKNIIALTQWSLIEGRKPIFDINRKVAEGGIIVNDNMTGEMRIV